MSNVARVSSYFRRYLRGERVAVWEELRALGPVPDALAEDVAAVADETMIRVGQDVARIAAALPELGWVSADGVEPHEPPTEGAIALADTLAEKVGLPFALEACLRRVGRVWFPGDCEALLLSYHLEPVPRGHPPGPEYPDPLCLPSAYTLAADWDEHGTEPGYTFALAPDERRKANVPGGTHDLALPSQVADPVLHGIAGHPTTTLVDYLRTSIRHGGFPGYSFAPELAPAALITLSTEPDF
ncbi:hypothetical protein Aglo03_54250 [Actinokineospora globicatena]|uniref:Uncharacterized protein n=1 Tax=Actinokineospora globicatena TaxID=103729 RepID=A0A9W6VC45_9PSEU|nr:hypothetical protein Aglo03_54250 [Actinokineospora globicatena]